MTPRRAGSPWASHRRFRATLCAFHPKRPVRDSGNIITRRDSGNIITRRDSGNIITGWLIKVSLVIIVLGIIVFDAISVGSAHIRVEDASSTAASAARDAVSKNRDVKLAADAATAELQSQGLNYHVVEGSVAVGPDGSVTLTTAGTAKTVVLKYLKPIAGWADVSATATAMPLD